MTADTDQRALFFDLETSLHRRAVRNSPEAVAALLADDFVEFALNGRINDKAGIIGLLRVDNDNGPVAVTDFIVRQLSPTVVLVTYTAVWPGRVVVLRSSIWSLNDGGAWKMTFHQGTRPTGR
jgi:hypothetical protein